MNPENIRRTLPPERRSAIAGASCVRSREPHATLCACRPPASQTPRASGRDASPPCNARLARRGRPRQLHDQHEDSDVLEIRAFRVSCRRSRDARPNAEAGALSCWWPHGRVSRLPPRSRDGSPGGSCGNRRLRREWEAPFDGSMCRPASRLRHGFRSSSPPRFPLGVLSYDLSPASLQTVEAGSYARPGNPPIARSRTPSGPGRILHRAVDPTRMMWSASSLYRWPSTCTSAEPRSAI